MKNQKPFIRIGTHGVLFASTRIHDLNTGESRLVDHGSHCNTNEELGAYEECVSSFKVIKTENFIVEPLT